MSVKERSAREAFSEIQRELGIRRRCYGRWVADGKLSDIDAQDRLERLEKAGDIVERCILLESEAAAAPAAPGASPQPAANGATSRMPGESNEDWAHRVSVAHRRYELGLPVSPASVTSPVTS